jgi:phage shock protein PspC (stress-responsive transcriptional regulator)
MTTGRSALYHGRDRVEGGRMTTSEPKGRPETGLRRSRRDRVLGGVCAGIAHGIGVDPLIVRIVAVLMVLVSGGAVVLAYLVAWVLIPRAANEPPATGAAASSEPPPRSAKEAWTAVGGELKSLAGHVREPARPRQGEDGDGQPEASSRPSVQSVDAAMTALGDRLRTPEVREGARRTLAGLSTAVEASVGELGSRARRSRSATEPAPPSSPRDEA